MKMLLFHFNNYHLLFTDVEELIRSRLDDVNTLLISLNPLNDNYFVSSRCSIPMRTKNVAFTNEHSIKKEMISDHISHRTIITVSHK